MKPYYQHAGITIYHGDCRELLPGLAYDWIATDPPYGINHPTDYSARGRDKPKKGTTRNILSRNYAPVFGDDKPFNPSWLLATGKPLLLWGANHYADKLPATSGWLVWDKERPHELDQASVELAWTNYVKGARIFRHLWNGMQRASQDPINHPTQKPEALHRWCFSLRWCPDGIVADPYMGSGSLLRAAKDTGRQAVGIEMEERYCEVAARRLSQEVFALEGVA
jgi:DNA modification methylase